MGIAALVFGLLVGFFHFQGAPDNSAEQEMLAVEPERPAAYAEASGGARSEAPASEVIAAPADDVEPAEVEAVEEEAPTHASLADAENITELAQIVADLAAARPENAGKTLTIALAQVYGEATLGDVATLTAAATKAAPDQAPAIAAAAARSLRDNSEPALAAAVATVVSLVPEQSRDIGLVVGAIIGDDIKALGMVAQTVAISTGEETFSSLSEGSGVPMGRLMKESTELGVRVPFDVPAYAAQLAPSPSMVASGDDKAVEREGDL